MTLVYTHRFVCVPTEFLISAVSRWPASVARKLTGPHTFTWQVFGYDTFPRERAKLLCLLELRERLEDDPLGSGFFEEHRISEETFDRCWELLEVNSVLSLPASPSFQKGRPRALSLASRRTMAPPLDGPTRRWFESVPLEVAVLGSKFPEARIRLFDLLTFHVGGAAETIDYPGHGNTGTKDLEYQHEERPSVRLWSTLDRRYKYARRRSLMRARLADVILVALDAEVADPDFCRELFEEAAGFGTRIRFVWVEVERGAQPESFGPISADAYWIRPGSPVEDVRIFWRKLMASLRKIGGAG